MGILKGLRFIHVVCGKCNLGKSNHVVCESVSSKPNISFLSYSVLLRSHERVGHLNHSVQAAAAVQHLVAHGVGTDVVAHNVLRVPVLATHALHVDGELSEIKPVKTTIH